MQQLRFLFPIALVLCIVLNSLVSLNPRFLDVNSEHSLYHVLTTRVEPAYRPKRQAYYFLAAQFQNKRLITFTNNITSNYYWPRLRKIISIDIRSYQSKLTEKEENLLLTREHWIISEDDLSRFIILLATGKVADQTHYVMKGKADYIIVPTRAMVVSELSKSVARSPIPTVRRLSFNIK